MRWRLRQHHHHNPHYDLWTRMTHKMINHRHEQIKEQRRAALLHLHLHGSTALESAAAADDEGEVVGSKFTVRGRRVGVGEAGGGEDSAALHAGLQTLLFEGEALEFR